MLARDEDILKAAEDWRKAGKGVALATVVETWGSAPRPVGSNLVIDQEGRTVLILRHIGNMVNAEFVGHF